MKVSFSFVPFLLLSIVVKSSFLRIYLIYLNLFVLWKNIKVRASAANIQHIIPGARSYQRISR
jgi:hypothetical protein